MLDAVSLLREIGAGGKPSLGRRVVIYGGGNTAMDAARTARRLGAEEALIVYRRDRAHMPAHEFEADEALSEGVKIKWLTTIKEIVEPSLTVERMELDADGCPQPTGEFETLEADAVVLALGQEATATSCARRPASRSSSGTVIVVDRHDDRRTRASSPAATWCRASAPSPWRSATASWRRAISTPGCADCATGKTPRPRRWWTSTC